MKQKLRCIKAAWMLLLCTACASTGDSTAPAAAGGASASGSAGASAPAAPLYTGDGGRGKSIAIVAPKAAGLDGTMAYLPALVQGEFVSNFSGYSALAVLDRQNLDEQYAEFLSGYYDDNAKAGWDLGHLPDTDYLMLGNITKTAAGYALQMQVTRTADKMTAASYSGNCTFAELDNLTGIRRASLKLLRDLGVVPTARAEAELSGAAAAQSVKAQTALAQGITAQKSGTEVAALSYYYQAAAFDPGLLEAANRAQVMSANVSSGNIGNDVRNDIQWRKDWLARLTETEQYFDDFFKTSSPPYGLFYCTAIEQGKIDYAKETIPLSIKYNLHAYSIWFDSVERALRAVYDGLDATKRKEDWGLAEWPEKPVTTLNPFRAGSKDFAVAFELVNENNKVLGRQTVTLKGAWAFKFFDFGIPITFDYKEDSFDRDRRGQIDYPAVNFGAVSANDITGALTIRIASVNGAAPQTAAQSGGLQITALEAFPTDFTFSRGAISGYIGPNEGNVVIPGALWGEPVTSIGKYVASGEYRRFASVVIPDSVISIGVGAFSGYVHNSSYYVRKVSIGANVNLGEYAFYRFSQDRYIKFAPFIDFYNNNGRKAGTYTYYDGRGGKDKWEYSPAR